MRAMNLNSYRFSISWPRIQPRIRAANSKGIDFYSRLVDALLEARIRPLVTLYHWDLPQALEDAGGWPNRDIAGRFADYAQLVAQALGDRVSDFILFNEPAPSSISAISTARTLPGRNSLLDFLRATHIVNLAQGAGFRAVKAARPSAEWARRSACRRANRLPIRTTTNGRRARARHHQCLVSRTRATRTLSGSAHVSAETAMGIKSGDMEQSEAPLDFIGINLYYRTIVSAPERAERAAHTAGMAIPREDEGRTTGPEDGHRMGGLAQGPVRHGHAHHARLQPAGHRNHRKRLLLQRRSRMRRRGSRLRRIAYHRQYLAELARSIDEAPMSAAITPGA